MRLVKYTLAIFTAHHIRHFTPVKTFSDKFDQSEHLLIRNVTRAISKVCIPRVVPSAVKDGVGLISKLL